MRKQRRQRKIEIFRLEDRVLFEAAGAAEAVEAVENASNPNPDRQNDISESERQEKEAQSVAKYAGPDGAAIQEPGAPVQDQGAGLTRPDAIQQDPAQKLVDGSGDFSDVPDVTQEHTSELSDFLNADFSVTTDSTLSFSDSLSSDSDTHELIVIDSDAAKDLDLDALSDKTEVLVLDNDSDAMEQLNAYLDSHDGKYDSIRFVTDGDSGADSAPDHLELNGREVSASDLDAVRDHLADGGDLSVQTALDDAAPVYTLTPDGDFELVHADDLHDAVIHPEIDETITVDASANVSDSALANPVEEGREELVIINSNIADRDVVLSQLGGRDVLEIDPSQDALSQIQDYLDANPDTRYDAIHILTHGNDQGFYLGSTQVTDAGQMTVFTGHMAENADFMLYGCNLAATERGQALIHEIADVTGCDVAASTDMTGAAAVGGDWVLEYNVGVVETASISLNADWNYRLATITVNSEAAESTTNATSLQSALNGWPNPDNPDQSRAAAIAGDIINIQSQTDGATIGIAITINANAETGDITISTTGVVLNGTGYTNVTINGNGGIEKSNLTVTGTFTSSGSISESTVNTTQGVIDINGGNVEISTLSASDTGSIDISAGNFSETAVTNSGTGSINISGGTFTESPVTHSGAGSTTITGGEFTGSEKTGTGISISGSGALTIKDNAGSFSGFEKAVEFSSSGTATITAGDFTRNVYGLVNNGTMSVSGAGVSFTSNHNVIDDSAATAGAGILNNASGELSVSDVTIGAMGGGNYYGLENHGSITALKDSTIQYNMMSGLRNEGSIDSINNVTLNENGLSIDEEGNSYTALGGGLYNSGTIKDFIDIQITNNHAAQGGGIYNTGEISADVNDRSFNIYISGNEATQGGGIYWGGGFLDTSALVYQYGDPDSRGLTGNTAHQGGGVYIASGDVLFQDFRLFENTADRVNLDAATYAGGGLYIASGAKVILDSVTVENNVVENCSNGIDTKYWQYYYNDPDLAIGDTGKATDKGGRGGGIYSEGTLTVLHSQFNKNVVNFANSSQLPDYYAFLDTLSMGGAIYSSGTLTVYDSYIHDNTAKNGLGGGIYLGGGSATIASTEYYTGESLWQQTGSLNSMIITGNTANGSSDGTQYAAGGFGGGIYSDSSVNLTLDSVTLSGNIATLTVASSSGTYDIGRGGGLYFGEADAYRTYSAVTSAPVLGNGVLTIDGTVRDLTNGSANVAELEMNRRTSLIFDNHAVSGSGLYINSASTVSIGNTEIYNNANTASSYFTNTNDAQNFFQNFVVSSNQKDSSVDIKPEAQDISAAGKLFTSSGIGLYLGGSGATASLDGVSIYGHDVDNAFGGGIYVTGDMYGSGLVHLNLVNTTLYDNAAAYGGGVYIGENASVNILNTTVAGNAAATAGGVYIIGSNSAVNILNSILVGNTGGDLAAESDAPAMNDMYSLFGSVLVKNSLTLQYEQQSVDPTSSINVEAKDIFADPTLANNWQIQGAQYSKEFTDSAGKVYYYDYAYGTTHTLAISAEGAAAYKGVYTAIDLATSLMYFNTLNSQAVAAGQTSGTWMNFSTRTAATVSSDKIVSSSQNGLNRQTGANGSVSYNTYNIGAYQLTVTDVFYYDTPAQNQLDPSGETRYEAYVGFQPSDGMTASFNNTEYTYNATTRTWNNTNNSYTPVTGDTLSVEGVDYTYDGTAWVATPVTGDTLTVEGVDYTYDGTAWIAAHTPGAGDTLTVNGETYQYNAETDAWTNQDDPSDTYTPKIGDTLSVEGVDYTYDGTNWTASYAPAAGTTVSVNGMDYTYDGTKWTTTHTPASGDTFGHDGTDYIYDGTNWVATYAPAAGDTFSHDDGTDYIYDGTNWVATHAPAAGDTFSHDGTVYIYDGTDWVATHAPAAGDTLSHDGTVYIYDGTDWVATHAPVAGDDTLFVNGVLYQFDGTDWVEVYSPEAGDTITMDGTDYVYNTSSHEWEVTCNPELGDTLTAADRVTYTYDGTNWTATYTPVNNDELTVDGVTYTYDGANWTATHTLATGDKLTAADGVTYTYDGTNWTATHTPAVGDTLTVNGKTYQYNVETDAWTNQDDPSDTYTPVNNDELTVDGVIYTYDGTNWTATHTLATGDKLTAADGVTYTYGGTAWTATHTLATGDKLTVKGVTYTYDGTAWTATHIPVEGDTFTFNGTEESTYDGTNWVVTYTPVNNNTLTVNGVTYTYDGNAWKDSAGNEYTLQIGAQIDGTDYVYNGENWVETYAPAKGNQITGTDYVYNGENWVETYAHENGDRINVDGKLYTYSSFYGSWRSSAGDEYTPEAGDRIVGTAYVYDADISAWVNTHLPADGNMIYSSGSIFTYNAMTGTWNNVAAVYTPVANDTWIAESVTYTYDGTHWIDTGNTQDPVSGDIITTADGTTYKPGIDGKLVENLPYRYYTASGEYYVRPIINTTDDTINPYDGSLSLREAILLAGENLTINYTLDPAIYGENPDAPVISEKFHFGTEIVLSEQIAAGNLEFIIGESNVYGTAADGTSLTSSFYDSIGINKGLTDSFGNDISYRIIAGTVDPTSYNVTPPASSLLPFEYDATDDATFQSLNLTLKVRDRDPVNNDPGRFRVFDVISGDITLYGEGAGSLTILGGNVSNDNNPNRPASERTDESISNFGGAIRLSGADATLTLNGVTINRGIANRGGAIYVADGTLNLIGTTKINGTVAHGFASAGDNVSQVTYGDGYVYTSGYGAGIYMAGGSLVIGMDALSAEKAGEVFYASNVTISGGTAAQYGGGIYLAGDSSLLGNHSLYAYDAENRLYAPVSESFTISGNSAVSGAGLYIATTGSVSLERATISGNTLRQGVSSNFKVPTSGIPASYGGGLYVAAGSSVSLKGVTVTGNVTATYVRPGSGSNPDVPNYVVSYGGGIYAEGTVTISESNLFLSGGDAPAQDIANSSISSNTALRGGGVYLADGGTFTMSGADPGKGGDVASVSGNNATAGSYTNETSNTTGQGGGLYVSAGATANLSNVVLSGNIANSVSSGAAADNNLSGRGGAVYTAGVFSLTNTTPSSETLRISMNDNSAAYGGAVYQAGGTVSLSYLSMYENKASGVTSGSVSTGGALYLANGTANILNATIAGNIGDAAIYTGAGSLTLTNTTLALNTGSNYGLVNSAATVFLRNTLVIGNGNSDDNNIKGEYTNDGYSLVGTKANGYSAELIFGTNGFDPATGVIQLDQTAENPALAGGYLYRDPAGNAYDQLGNDRTETPGDGVYTIGAVIAGSVSPTSVLVNTFTDDTTSDNELYSLREAIQDAAGGDITIAFDLEALQNEMAGGAEASFILDSLLSWTAGTVTIDGTLLASLGTVSITAGTGNTAGLFALAGTSGLVLSNFTVSGTGTSFGNDGAALSLTGSSTATLTNVTVQNVVTSGNGAVSVANGASLTLAGNTVFASNQAVNGGAIYNAGSLTVSGMLEFTGNQATDSGGAIYNAAGTLTITDAVFSGNSATVNGGAIYNAGSLTVTGDFASNQAVDGGAIYNAGTLTVSDSAVLQGNIATGSGGAIYNAGTLTVSDSAVLQGNIATGSGGAIYNAGSLTVSGTEFLANESEDGGAIYNGGALQFTEGTNTVFAGNTATGNGGAIYNASSDLQLVYASFTDNKAVNGGAFYNAGQNVSITGVVFGGMSEDGTVEGNTAANGGAIYNAAGAVLTLDAASAFSYNEATADGGALYNEGALTMSGGSITGNTAANGGAIYHKGTILTVTDAVFSGNAATANGGAIYNASTESVQFTGTLLTDNIATGNGGAFYNAGQNVSVTGVVFGGMSEDGTEEGNTAANGGAIYNAAGAVLSLSGVTAITANTASGMGGGIYNAGSLNVADTLSILENQAGSGAGLYFAGTATLDAAANAKVTVKANTAAEAGGALYNQADGLVLSGSMMELTGNKALKGGAIYNDGAELILQDITISGNSAGDGTSSGDGGAVYTTGNLILSMVSLTGNSAVNGGAVYQNGGTIEIKEGDAVSITGNSAVNGGAVYQNGGTIEIKEGDAVSITGNSAVNGGAVYAAGGTFSLYLDGTNALDGNTATNGGVFYNNGGAISVTTTPSMTGKYLTGNTVTGLGGVFYNENGSLTVENIALTENSAADGSVLYLAGGEAMIGNATLALNKGEGATISATGGTLKLISVTAGLNENTGLKVTGTSTSVEMMNTLLAGNGADGTSNVIGYTPGAGNVWNADAAKIFVAAGFDQETGTIALRNAADNPAATGGVETPYYEFDQRGERRDLLDGVFSVGAYTLTMKPAQMDTVTTARDVVDAEDGETSLREAIEYANAMAAQGIVVTITFDYDRMQADAAAYQLADASTIILDAALGTLNVTASELLLDGTLPSGAITVDAGNLTASAFTVTGGSNIFQNFTVIGGAAANGGAFQITGSEDSVTSLNNMTVTGGSAVSGSGGLVYVNGGGLAIDGGTYTNGVAGGDGGAVYFSGSSLTIDGAAMEGNKAVNGGAVYAVLGAGTQLLVGETTAVSMTGNAATNGGALYLNTAAQGQNSKLSISGQINGNTATTAGGAIYAEGALTLSNVGFQGNTVSNGSGGAIYAAGALTVDGGSFIENSAEKGSGGAIYGAGTVTLNSVTFTGNMAKTAGGAVYAGETLTIGLSKDSADNSAFTSNSAANGGAVYANNGLNITYADFSGNGLGTNADFNATDGGAIYLASGTGSIGVGENGSVSITGNTAAHGGGAIYIASGATMETGKQLVSLSDNKAGSISAKTPVGGQGGAIYNAGTLTMNGGGQWELDYETMAYYLDGGLTASGNKALDNGDDIAGDGGFLYNAGTATLSNFTVSNNTANGSGGAIHSSGDALTLNGMLLRGNNATNGNGGAVAVTGGNLTVNSSEFSGNAAIDRDPDSKYLVYKGGAIYFSGSGNLTIQGELAIPGLGTYGKFDTRFISNTATRGGALYLETTGGTVDISNVSVIDNIGRDNGATGGDDESAAYVSQGAGFWIGGTSSSRLTLENVTFAENHQQTDGGYTWGGGLYVEGVDLNLVNTTFYANSANHGGALFVNDTDVSIVNTTIAYNEASNVLNSGAGGGGIFVTGLDASLSMLNSIVTGNVNAGADPASEYYRSDIVLKHPLDITVRYSLLGGVWQSADETQYQAVDTTASNWGDTNYYGVDAADLFEFSKDGSTGVYFGYYLDAARLYKNVVLNPVYGTTPTLMIRPDSLAAYAGVYAAIDRTTGDLYYNTLNYETTLKSDSASYDKWMQVAADGDVEATVDAGNIITDGQNGWTRTDQLSFNVYNVGAHALNVLDPDFYSSEYKYNVSQTYHVNPTITTSNDVFNPYDGLISLTEANYLAGKTLTRTFLSTNPDVQNLFETFEFSSNVVYNTDPHYYDSTLNALRESGAISLYPYAYYLPTAMVFQGPHDPTHSIVVTTVADVVNDYDGVTSLREALALAEQYAAEGKNNTITFTVDLVLLEKVLDPIDFSVLIDGGTGVLVDGTAIAGGEGDYIFTTTGEGNSIRFNNITIDAGRNDASVENGNYLGGIHNEGAQVTMNGGGVENGYSVNGGGILNAAGLLLLNNAAFSGNQASFDGGAISNSGTLSVGNASFRDNQAAQKGGAIYTDTPITVNNSTFEINRTHGDGGAIYGSDVTVNGGSFTDNHADKGGSGGAIYGSDVTVNGGSFSLNNAGNGGALSGDSLTVNNAAFTDNTANHGGAISGSDVTVNGGTFDQNSATGNGGAILATGALSVHADFTGNEASSNGGAIAAFGADTTISGTFTGNTAYNENGGAVYLDQGGTLANITLTNNIAQDGAAVYSADGALTMNSAIVTGSNATAGSVVTSRGDKTVIRNSSLNNNTASGSVVNAPNGELFLISTTVAENSAAEADVSGVSVSIVNSTIAEADRDEVLVQASGDVQIANAIVVGAEAGTTVIEAGGDIDGAYSVLGQVSSVGTFNNEYGTVTLDQSYGDVFGKNTVNGNGLISLPSGSPATAGVWTAVDTDSDSEAYGSVYYTTRPEGMWTQGYNPNRMSWNLLGVGFIGGRGNVSPGATVSAGNAGGTYPSMGSSWNLAWTPDFGHGLNSDFIKPSENGVAHSIYDIYNAVSDRLYANPGYLLSFRNEVSGASRLDYDFMHEFDDRYRTMGEFSVTIGRFDLGFVPSGETHITVNVKGDVSDDFTRYTTTPYLSDGTPLIPEELKPMNSETEPPAAEGTAALPEGLEEKVMAYLGRAEIFKNDFDKALDRLLALNV